jgi:hypothetical protein
MKRETEKNDAKDSEEDSEPETGPSDPDLEPHFLRQVFDFETWNTHVSADGAPHYVLSNVKVFSSEVPDSLVFDLATVDLQTLDFSLIASAKDMRPTIRGSLVLDLLLHPDDSDLMPDDTD